MKEKTFWVYILLCINGSYYTGYTDDVQRRFEKHVQGTSHCKYTRSFKPVKILQSWPFPSKTEALRAEKWIKSLPKNQKERLIASPTLINQPFSNQQS
jgi:putative endonuclease